MYELNFLSHEIFYEYLSHKTLRVTPQLVIISTKWCVKKRNLYVNRFSFSVCSMQ